MSYFKLRLAEAAASRSPERFKRYLNDKVRKIAAEKSRERSEHHQDLRDDVGQLGIAQYSGFLVLPLGGGTSVLRAAGLEDDFTSGDGGNYRCHCYWVDGGGDVEELPL